MYIGRIVIASKYKDDIYILVKSEDNTDTLVIKSSDSLVVLCDKEPHDNSIPTIVRMSFEEFSQNITGNGQDAYFDGELENIRGISIV